MQVADNAVSVLTNYAAPAEQLSSTAAREALAAARSRPANSPELMAIRDRAELQARAQLASRRKGRQVARRTEFIPLAVEPNSFRSSSSTRESGVSIGIECRCHGDGKTLKQG